MAGVLVTPAFFCMDEFIITIVEHAVLLLAGHLIEHFEKIYLILNCRTSHTVPFQKTAAFRFQEEFVDIRKCMKRDKMSEHIFQADLIAPQPLFP